jgi:hypothetical protein
MDVRAIFGLSVLFCFIASAIVAALYIVPPLRMAPLETALLPLVVPHMFRFIGLSFLVPGVVSPSLPPAFARSAAYGDLLAAILAVVAVLALATHASWAIAIVWLLNLWGAADLLFAMLQGAVRLRIDAGLLGAAFFIPTVIVPPLLVTHALIFWLLLR